MKKILFVNISLYNGGAEKSLINILNELPKEQYDIDLLLFRPEGLFLKQVPSGVHILKTPRILTSFYGPLRKSGVYGLIKIIATIIARGLTRNGAEAAGMRWKYFYSKLLPKLSGQYDVAIAYMSGEAMYYVEEKVDARRKLTWVHNDYREAEFSEKYDRPYMNRMDAVVTISEKCLSILKEVFPELEDRLFYVANITSSCVVKVRAEECEPGEFLSGVPAVLSIGRLTEQKGFDLAIQAASIMKKQGICFRWYVIGDGHLKDELSKMIRVYQVEDCFKFIGIRENPYPYIKKCTVFVQTSRYEGKSIVLDEAKILGAPIVVTNYPTVVDQIVNEVEGLIVAMVPKDIANGIIKMITNKKMNQKIRDHLRQHEYGNQSEVEKYCKLIDGRY